MTAVQTAATERPAHLRPVKKDLTLKGLGPNIKAARLGRGYSQSDLADMLSLAKQTISQWENGDCVPTIESLVRLAKALNVDPTHILSGVSSDLAPAKGALRRRDIASQIVPLYAIETAGGILMGRIDPKTVEPVRHIPVAHKHPPRSIAFEVKGDAMLAQAAGPSFQSGDIVTLVAATMAERGQIVLAHVDGEFVFRRFLPKAEGSVDGALLRALNPDYQDITMQAGDAILGLLKEHIRHY
jgi:transcriptional regulator with XRE-family HTH domain